MNRLAIARRYAPLVLIAAVQLVTMGLLPSTGPQHRLVAGQAIGQATQGGGPAAGSPSVSESGANGPGSATAGSGDVTSSGPGRIGATGQTAIGGGAGAAPAGDTTHCMGGRQFDASIYFYAPPCAAKWPGGGNGGATYQGVTATTVKIVEYIPQSNAGLDAAEQQAGLYISPAQLQAFRTAAQDFINKNFELYGRKITIQAVNGTCNITPPDIACLRNDFSRIVKDYQPYVIIYATGDCSACFDEISQLQTVSLGGEYFSNQFAAARAPYHWDVQPSGSDLNAAIGQFWCANLAHKPAQYAIHQPGNMNGKARRLGVIGENDPEVQAGVQAVKSELAKCGDKLYAEYYYSADFSTAAQDVAAGISQMEAAGVTSIYYLGNLSGPGYYMGAQQGNHYYPENIMSGEGGQDIDEGAQQLQTNPIACPSGPPCPFSTGFGLSTAVYEPLKADAGARIWHADGNTGPPPYDFVTETWDYYALAATLIQAAGPQLTPQNMDAGIRTYGLRGDTNHELRGFPAGSYTWGHDFGMEYWNKDLLSSYDAKTGSWVKVGTRVPLGGWIPGALGQLPNRG